MEYNKVNVKICGNEYYLQTKEKPSYFRDIADRLDEKINNFMSVNKNISTSSASILVALELMEEKFKVSKDIDNVLKEIDFLKKELKITQDRLEEALDKLEKYERS